MRIKNILVLFICFLLQLSTHAQSNTPNTQVYSKIITGSFLFSSFSGGRYEDNDNNRSTISGTSINIQSFLANKFATGIKSTYNFTSNNNKESIRQVSIGPNTTYFFDTGSTTIPFIGSSMRYSYRVFKDNNGDKDYTRGYLIEINSGLAITKGHLLILLEGGYIYERGRYKRNGNFESRKLSGSIFYLSIGFGISLYKTK